MNGRIVSWLPSIDYLVPLAEFNYLRPHIGVDSDGEIQYSEKCAEILKNWKSQRKGGAARHSEIFGLEDGKVKFSGTACIECGDKRLSLHQIYVIDDNWCLTTQRIKRLTAMYNYESQTYTKIAEEFGKVCAWLDELGMRYSATRVGHYKRFIERMAGHQSAGRLSKVVDQIDLEKFANAYYEAAEFIRIYEGLNAARDKSFVSRLKDSMRGHEFHVMDENDRSGRDISFELSMAATFSRVADYMNFGHTADLEMKVDGGLYYVECKRLKSKGMVEERVKEGLKQLRSRCSAVQDADPKGILCLSIGRILNPDFGLLKCQSESDISLAVARVLKGFEDEFKSVWRTNADARTIGVVVVLDAIAMTTIGPAELSTVHQLSIDALSEVGTAFFISLQNKLF